MPVKPLLKWVGGKTQILDKVLDAIPECYGTYIEPFVGGGSVLLAVLETGKAQGPVLASDLNPDLIHFYEEIQERPEEFIQETMALLSSVTDLKETFYAERTKFNDPACPKSAARFWFINKTCFRGMFRTGPKGYNVPFGHGTLPTLDPDHVRVVSDLLQCVEFRCCPYTEALMRATQDDDVVYLDPPYVPVSAVSFVGYTVEGFKAEDHARLFTMCKSLPCTFVMSNADAPAVRTAFEDYKVDTVGVRRAINAKKPGTRTTEVIVSS
jgi:DNA adenine methylase